MLEQVSDEKRQLFSRLAALAGAGRDSIASRLQNIFAPDAKWRVAHPLNDVTGRDAALSEIYAPLFSSLPDMERRDEIFLCGYYEDKLHISAMGHYCGTFVQDYLGIPATGGAVYLRYGEAYELHDGKVAKAHLLWDFLDLMRQAHVWPLGGSRGAEQMWPGPLTNDGTTFNPSGPEQSAASLAQTLAMHKTLGDYNDTRNLGRQGLLEMPQRAHWHPKMMWYGPAGIGTARGLSGFVDHHQLPFRTAFPNRKGGSQWDEIASEKARHGGGHYIQIGDGPYSMTGGWPSVFAHHSGSGFLGLAPTNRIVTMRVMDFYHHHEGLIRENWVPIDMIDLLGQMGVDVFAKVRTVAAARRSR